MKDRPHDEAMAELFREDPAFAIRFLDFLCDGGDETDLGIALRQMARAAGRAS